MLLHSKVMHESFESIQAYSTAERALFHPVYLAGIPCLIRQYLMLPSLI
jgi:hypothetical protein